MTRMSKYVRKQRRKRNDKRRRMREWAAIEKARAFFRKRVQDEVKR